MESIGEVNSIAVVCDGPLGSQSSLWDRDSDLLKRTTFRPLDSPFTRHAVSRHSLPSNFQRERSYSWTVMEEAPVIAEPSSQTLERPQRRARESNSQKPPVPPRMHNTPEHHMQQHSAQQYAALQHATISSPHGQTRSEHHTQHTASQHSMIRSPRVHTTPEHYTHQHTSPQHATNSPHAHTARDHYTQQHIAPQYPTIFSRPPASPEHYSLPHISPQHATVIPPRSQPAIPQRATPMLPRKHTTPERSSQMHSSPGSHVKPPIHPRHRYPDENANVPYTAAYDSVITEMRSRIKSGSELTPVTSPMQMTRSAALVDFATVPPPPQFGEYSHSTPSPARRRFYTSPSSSEYSPGTNSSVISTPVIIRGGKSESGSPAYRFEQTDDVFSGEEYDHLEDMILETQIEHSDSSDETSVRVQMLSTLESERLNSQPASSLAAYEFERDTSLITREYVDQILAAAGEDRENTEKSSTFPYRKEDAKPTQKVFPYTDCNGFTTSPARTMLAEYFNYRKGLSGHNLDLSPPKENNQTLSQHTQLPNLNGKTVMSDSSSFDSGSPTSPEPSRSGSADALLSADVLTEIRALEYHLQLVSV